MGTTVFVYGTLKRGCRNHGVIRTADFLMTTSTRPKYVMYDCGSYPALVERDPGMAVIGELFEVSAGLLEVLDRFEDVPRQYCRSVIALTCGRFAEAYFYRGPTAHLPMCGPVWEDKQQ